MAQILLATQKPFSVAAVNGIRDIIEGAGHSLTVLEQYQDPSELTAAIGNADAVLVRSDQIDRAVVQAAARLKLVVRAGAGYDTIDLEACTERGIVVMNTPGQNSNAVAELVIGLMIYSARNFFQPGTGQELSGKRLGLQAYGNVAKLVAKHAKAMGMIVSAFDPYAPAGAIQQDGVTAAESLEDLYAHADFLSLHIPATPETTGSIGQKLLSALPQGATVINTARAEVINELELLAVLGIRTDLKYVADIMPHNYADLQAKYPDRVYATPKKMGAETAEANVAAGLAAARQAVGFLDKGDTTFQVNH